MSDCVQNPLPVFLNNGSGFRNESYVPHFATCLEGQDKVVSQMFSVFRHKNKIFKSEKVSCFYTHKTKFFHSPQLKGDLPSCPSFRTYRWHFFFIQRNEHRRPFGRNFFNKMFFLPKSHEQTIWVYLLCQKNLHTYNPIWRTLLWQSCKCYLGLR